MELEPLGMTSLRQANVEMIWKIFFTFDFHILHEHSPPVVEFSPVIVFQQKKAIL